MTLHFTRTLLLTTLFTPLAAAQPTRYSCSTIQPHALTSTTVFTATTAGFDLDSTPTVAHNSCFSDKVFFLSFPVSEGSYRVSVVLGGDKASTTTVWSEARRLMLEKVFVKAGASVTRSFDVNVRVPEFTGSDGTARRVRLKPREIGNLNWDSKLTIEFNGDNPSLRTISITPILPTAHEPVVYLAGDSTVVDQDAEPWAAWGQMLPRFFLPGVVVANHAESGETTRSFVGELRFPKIFATIQPGDYLFLQFGHNDMKIGAVSIDEYKKILTDTIAQARAKGATPVLVTAMNRHTFDPEGHITNSLAGYPDAVREVAAAEKTPLLDLNAMSKTLFEAMGPEASLKAFMNFEANTFPNQTEAIHDATHFDTYGAYELARAIVHSIRQQHVPLEKFLDPAVPDFDPAHPDTPAAVALPFTPIRVKGDVTKVPQT